MRKTDVREYRKDDAYFEARPDRFNPKDEDHERRIQAHCERVQREYLNTRLSKAGRPKKDGKN